MFQVSLRGSQVICNRFYVNYFVLTLPPMREPLLKTVCIIQPNTIVQVPKTKCCKETPPLPSRYNINTYVCVILTFSPFR